MQVPSFKRNRDPKDLDEFLSVDSPNGEGVLQLDVKFTDSHTAISLRVTRLW